MAITYHSGRRLQGSSYTAPNPTTSGFAGTWGKDPSNSQFEVSGGKLNFLDSSSSTGDRSWIDLGTDVSETQWVIRFRFRFTTLASGTHYYEFGAGLSDTTVNNDTNQDFIGVRCLPSSNLNLWRPRVCNGDEPRRGSSDNRNTYSFATGVDYYCEMKRTSSTDWSISLSTTNVYGGDIYNDLYTTATTGVTGLRYFKFGDAVTNTTSGANMEGYVDVFEFYNGVSSASATSSGDVDISANYGTKSIDGNYTVLKFTESGVFTPTSAFNVEYLVVGGGGAGGGRIGGGGGAGGFQTNFGGTAIGVTAQPYSITVGTGGSGGDGNNSSGQATNGYNGTSSIFSTITSIGGGGGGAYQTAQATDGVNGGSGGGGGGNSSGSSGGTSTSNGNNGGTGLSGGSSAGGGGGAGAVGANGASASIGGAGGVGLSNSITGSAVYYAGGGGGASDASVSAGGNGGGGAGGKGNSPEIIGTAGTAGTGGGGGGSRNDNIQGATGGSGVVILRFLTSDSIFYPSISQVGSRFEETDTRKIYHLDDIDWKEENDGNIPNFRSASWYEQLSGETP